MMYIGGLQILPAPPLKLLKQTHKEGTCVVCMARPSQYGLVVSERGLVLRCCAAYCVKESGWGMCACAGNLLYVSVLEDRTGVKSLSVAANPS